MNAKNIFSSVKSYLPSIKQIGFIIIFLVAIYWAYNWGAGNRKENEPAMIGTSDIHDHQVSDEEMIWTCSMHPQIKRNEPGQCPICGMDLVPEKTSKAPSTKKPAKTTVYACPMNCVPPLPNPGKCPICGMDLVPIDTEVALEGDSERRLVMSKDAIALAEIQTTQVERRWVENEVRMVGLVDYDETRLAEVTAYVGGRLDRLYVDFTGIRVRKGDHMVYLYSPDLLISQEELLQAKRDYEGLSKDTLSLVRESSRKTLEAARERLRLWGLTPEQIQSMEKGESQEDHVTIYAPIGGTVIERHQKEGNYIKTGDPIYTIADLSKLWVNLKAYESDLPWLRYGQDVRFSAEAYPGEEFHGRISFISPILDSMTRTVNVRVNVDNQDEKLKPGMFSRAVVNSRLAKGGKVIEPDLAGKWICPMHPEVIKEKPGQCDVCGMDLVTSEELGFVSSIPENPPLVIPASAPLVTGKRAVVYVEVPDQEKPTYEGREIVLGPRAGDYYLVLEGLLEGEQVVTQGAFKIDSSLQIIAKRSMMRDEFDEE